MYTMATIATGFVALLHFYILYLEMFLWTTAKGRKTFGRTQEFAEASKTLAANQGLYNGFSGCGAALGNMARANEPAHQGFFLGCVVEAGVFGAATSSKKILFVQALHGAIALALVLGAWCRNGADLRQTERHVQKRFVLVLFSGPG